MFLRAEPQHPHLEAQVHILLHLSITLTPAFSLSVLVSAFLTNGHVLLVSELLRLCSCFFTMLPFACLSLCLSFGLSTLPSLPQACHQPQDDLKTILLHLPEPMGDYSSQMTSLDPELYPIQTTTHSQNLVMPDHTGPYLPCCS